MVATESIVIDEFGDVHDITKLDLIEQLGLIDIAGATVAQGLFE